MKLGDLIERLTYYSGIKFLVKKYIKNCNCDKRQEQLNEIELF